MYNLVGKYFGSMRFPVFCIGLLLLAVTSCDKVTNPIIATTKYATLPTTTPDHITMSTGDNLTKVLLEDYMGHFCTNCPAAVTVADGILSGPNGNQVVSMEVNVGYEADTAHTKGGPAVPGGLPDTAFKNNYITTAGTAWDAALTDCGVQGWPQGMIDRHGYNNPPGPGSPDVQYSDWADSVSTILTTTPQVASISMVDSCWIKQQIFGTQVKVALNNAPTTGYTYYLQMAVVEDSIADWQINGGTALQYYIHHFVLRSDINGSWGNEITFTGAGIPVTNYYTFTSTNFRYNGTSLITTTSAPAVPAKLWNMAHCYVIAFLYQRTNGNLGSDYKVLQAQIVHL